MTHARTLPSTRSHQPFVARAAEICSSALPSGSPACEPVLALVGAARALYQQLVAQNAQLVLQAAQLEGLRARLASAEAAQRLAICAPSDGERGVLAPLPAGARLSSGTPSTTRRGGRTHEPKPRAASARSTGSSALSLSELEVGEDGARVGPAVLRAGWLKKRSFFLGQWRLRWVELAAGHLVTRATCEPGAPSTLSLNLGSMAQSKAVSVEPRSLCSFDVRANGTLYAFEAESAGMRDEWVRTLRAELARPTQRAEG